jgi:hypothetical protein
MGDVNGDWDPTGASRAERSGPVGVDSPVASIPDLEAATRSVVTVPVSLDGLRGRSIGAYQFDVYFDPAVISPVQAAASIAGTRGEGLSVVSNSPASGVLKVAVYGAVPVEGDGVYADLRFNVIGPVGAGTSLKIGGFIIDDGSIAVASRDGVLTVTRGRFPILAGTLSTADGQAVPFAQVSLISADSKKRSVITDENGRFEFGGLEMGQSYTLTTVEGNFRLTPRPVAISVDVTNVDILAEP